MIHPQTLVVYERSVACPAQPKHGNFLGFRVDSSLLFFEMCLGRLIGRRMLVDTMTPRRSYLTGISGLKGGLKTISHSSETSARSERSNFPPSPGLHNGHVRGMKTISAPRTSFHFLKIGPICLWFSEYISESALPYCKTISRDMPCD